MTAITAKAAIVTRAPPKRSASRPPYGPGERADERTEEGEGHGCAAHRDAGERRELVGDELGEDAGEADERAEGSDVEQGEQPQVRLAERRGGAREVGLGGGQVVHVARRAEHGEQDERHPDPAGERQVEGRGGADGDDDRHDELGDGRAEVAAGGVEPERPALLALRVEEGDVRHRAGEVAAAEAGEGRDAQQHRERRLRVADADREGDRGQQQQARGDDRPVAAADERDEEGVGDAQRGADEARDRDEPEDLAAVEGEARRRKEHGDDAPQLPDRRSRGTRRRSTTSGCASRSRGRRLPTGRGPPGPTHRSIGRSDGRACARPWAHPVRRTGGRRRRRCLSS